MSKKRHRKQKTRPQGPPAPPRFTVGDSVRAKPGTTASPDPDIPLGGWSGTVEEVDSSSRPPSYLVHWDPRTLEQIHPVYFKRCERDDDDPERMWLEEGELESATGVPVPIEQPRQIVTRPLRKNDPEDRIRAVFGHSSDDPLPPVTPESSRTYHQYLSTHLSFPFEAKFTTETGPLEEKDVRVVVVGLLPPEDADEDEGLLCKAIRGDQSGELPLIGIGVFRRGPNRQLVEDYTDWFVNAPDESEDLTEGPSSDVAPPPEEEVLAVVLFLRGIYGAVFGVVLGVLLGAVEGAMLAAAVGAAILGALAGILGGFPWGPEEDVLQGRRELLCNSARAGTVLGMIGALAGAVIAAMIAQYLGALIGGALGALLGWLTSRKTGACAPMCLLGVIGGTLGALGTAVYNEPALALVGAMYGAGAGAAAWILHFLIFRGWRALLDRTPGG